MSMGWLKDNKRGFRRRAFLRGAGTVVSLPILDSLIPRDSRAFAATDLTPPARRHRSPPRMRSSRRPR